MDDIIGICTINESFLKRLTISLLEQAALFSQQSDTVIEEETSDFNQSHPNDLLLEEEELHVNEEKPIQIKKTTSELDFDWSSIAESNFDLDVTGALEARLYDELSALEAVSSL
jgi:hypothetical protein